MAECSVAGLNVQVTELRRLKEDLKLQLRTMEEEGKKNNEERKHLENDLDNKSRELEEVKAKLKRSEESEDQVKTDRDRGRKEVERLAVALGAAREVRPACR